MECRRLVGMFGGSAQCRRYARANPSSAALGAGLSPFAGEDIRSGGESRISRDVWDWSQSQSAALGAGLSRLLGPMV